MRAMSCTHLLALGCGRPSQMSCYVSEGPGGGSSSATNVTVPLLAFAPHFAGHFQHIGISRTRPDTCTASPISHRLREPFPPARPDHSSLLFPGNSDCWQGGYCSLQAASSAPEHLGTLEPLLSQIGMTNPGSTWGMLYNQRGCKDGRQRSILLSPLTISPCQDFGQRPPSSHSHRAPAVLLCKLQCISLQGHPHALNSRVNAS